MNKRNKTFLTLEILHYFTFNRKINKNVNLVIAKFRAGLGGWVGSNFETSGFGRVG